MSASAPFPAPCSAGPAAPEPLTHQRRLEELVRLNLVQGRFEENAVFSKLLFIALVNGAAELLGLMHCQLRRFPCPLPLPARGAGRTHLVIEKLEVGLALVVAVARLLFRVLLFAVPVGVVVVPLVILAKIVVRLEVKVVPQGLFAVCANALSVPARTSRSHAKGGGDAR